MNTTAAAGSAISTMGGMAATTTTAHTSAASFDAERPRWQASKQKALFDLVLGAQRSGAAADMSMRELQAAYERRHGQRIELSSISSCCHGLVAAGRLVRATPVRPCTITGRDILPLSVPAKQARLVA